MRNVIKAISRTSRQRNPQVKCQSGSKNAKIDPTVPCPLSTFRNGYLLHVIIKVSLRARAAAELEDVSRSTAGIQFHIITGPLPEVARIAEQFVHLIRLLGVESEDLEREVHPTGVGMVGVEVHHDQDHVRAVCGALTVTDELIIIDGMKMQAPVAVQSGILPPDAIHPGDKIL